MKTRWRVSVLVPAAILLLSLLLISLSSTVVTAQVTRSCAGGTLNIKAETFTELVDITDATDCDITIGPDVAAVGFRFSDAVTRSSIVADGVTITTRTLSSAGAAFYFASQVSNMRRIAFRNIKRTNTNEPNGIDAYIVRHGAVVQNVDEYELRDCAFEAEVRATADDPAVVVAARFDSVVDNITSFSAINVQITGAFVMNNKYGNSVLLWFTQDVGNCTSFRVEDCAITLDEVVSQETTLLHLVFFQGQLVDMGSIAVKKSKISVPKKMINVSQDVTVTAVYFSKTMSGLDKFEMDDVVIDVKNARSSAKSTRLVGIQFAFGVSRLRGSISVRNCAIESGGALYAQSSVQMSVVVIDGEILGAAAPGSGPGSPAASSSSSSAISIANNKKLFRSTMVVLENLAININKASAATSYVSATILAASKPLIRLWRVLVRKSRIRFSDGINVDTRGNSGVSATLSVAYLRYSISEVGVFEVSDAVVSIQSFYVTQPAQFVVCRLFKAPEATAQINISNIHVEVTNVVESKLAFQSYAVSIPVASEFSGCSTAASTRKDESLNSTTPCGSIVALLLESDDEAARAALFVDSNTTTSTSYVDHNVPFSFVMSNITFSFATVRVTTGSMILYMILAAPEVANFDNITFERLSFIVAEGGGLVATGEVSVNMVRFSRDVKDILRMTFADISMDIRGIVQSQTNGADITLSRFYNDVRAVTTFVWRNCYVRAATVRSEGQVALRLLYSAKDMRVCDFIFIDNITIIGESLLPNNGIEIIATRFHVLTDVKNFSMTNVVMRIARKESTMIKDVSIMGTLILYSRRINSFTWHNMLLDLADSTTLTVEAGSPGVHMQVISQQLNAVENITLQNSVIRVNSIVTTGSQKKINIQHTSFSGKQTRDKYGRSPLSNLLVENVSIQVLGSLESQSGEVYVQVLEFIHTTANSTSLVVRGAGNGIFLAGRVTASFQMLVIAYLYFFRSVVNVQSISVADVVVSVASTLNTASSATPTTTIAALDFRWNITDVRSIVVRNCSVFAHMQLPKAANAAEIVNKMDQRAYGSVIYFVGGVNNFYQLDISDSHMTCQCDATGGTLCYVVFFVSDVTNDFENTAQQQQQQQLSSASSSMTFSRCSTTARLVSHGFYAIAAIVPFSRTLTAVGSILFRDVAVNAQQVRGAVNAFAAVAVMQLDVTDVSSLSCDNCTLSGNSDVFQTDSQRQQFGMVFPGMEAGTVVGLFVFVDRLKAGSMLLPSMSFNQRPKVINMHSLSITHSRVDARVGSNALCAVALLYLGDGTRNSDKIRIAGCMMRATVSGEFGNASVAAVVFKQPAENLKYLEVSHTEIEASVKLAASTTQQTSANTNNNNKQNNKAALAEAVVVSFEELPWQKNSGDSSRSSVESLIIQNAFLRVKDLGDGRDGVAALLRVAAPVRFGTSGGSSSSSSSKNNDVLISDSGLILSNGGSSSSSSSSPSSCNHLLNTKLHSENRRPCAVVRFGPQVFVTGSFLLSGTSIAPILRQEDAKFFSIVTARSPSFFEDSAVFFTLENHRMKYGSVFSNNNNNGQQQQSNNIGDPRIEISNLQQSSWSFKCDPPWRRQVVKDFLHFAPLASAKLVDFPCLLTSTKSLLPTSTLSRAPSLSETITEQIFVPYVSSLRSAASAAMATANVLSVLSGPTEAGAGARSRHVMYTIAQMTGVGRCGAASVDVREDREKDAPGFSASPFQIFAGDDGGYSAGKVVGNPLFVFLLFGVGSLAFYVKWRIGFEREARQHRRRSDDDKLKGLFPKPKPLAGFGELVAQSNVLLPVTYCSIMLLDPTIAAGVSLAFSKWAAVGWRVVGILVSLAILGGIGFLFFKCLYRRRVIEKFNPMIVRSKPPQRDENSFVVLMKYVFFPEGEWIVPPAAATSSSSRRNNSNNNKKKITPALRQEALLALPLFKKFVDRAPRFLVAEVASLVGCALSTIIASAIGPAAASAGCVAQAVITIIILLVHLAAVLRYRPAQKRIGKVIVPILDVLGVVVLSIALSQQQKQDGGNEDVIGSLMMMISTISLVTSIATMVGFAWRQVYLLLEKRQLEKKEKEDAEAKRGLKALGSGNNNGRQQRRGRDSSPTTSSSPLSRNGDDLLDDHYFSSPRQAAATTATSPRRNHQQDNNNNNDNNLMEMLLPTTTPSRRDGRKNNNTTDAARRTTRERRHHRPMDVRMMLDGSGGRDDDGDDEQQNNRFVAVAGPTSPSAPTAVAAAAVGHRPMNTRQDFFARFEELRAKRSNSILSSNTGQVDQHHGKKSGRRKASV